MGKKLVTVLLNCIILLCVVGGCSKYNSETGLVFKYEHGGPSFLLNSPHREWISDIQTRPTRAVQPIRLTRLHEIAEIDKGDEGENLTPLQEAENSLLNLYATADDLQELITKNQGWGRLDRVESYKKELEKVQGEIREIEVEILELRAPIDELLEAESTVDDLDDDPDGRP